MPGGFSQPHRIPGRPDPQNRGPDPEIAPKTPQNGGFPDPPAGPRKTTPKVLFSDPGPPNTSLRYPLKGKNGKKSVFDIEGFGGSENPLKRGVFGLPEPRG